MVMTVPTTERARLVALQQRHRQLLAMLAVDVKDINLDDLDRQLASRELIAAEMMAVTDTQLAILDELARRTQGHSRRLMRKM